MAGERVKLYKVRRLHVGGQYRYLRVRRNGGRIEHNWVDDWLDGTAFPQSEAAAYREDWRRVPDPSVLYHSIVPCL
jgi:hypothetical protein